jgi:preprotein translocase subunit SecG
MILLVTIVHIIVSIGLILVVLLQTGKGADMGAVFGGSSSTIFGSSGAGNFLSRLTTGMAVVFMITSLTLGYFAGKKPTASVFDSRTEASQPTAEPAKPRGQALPEPAATPRPQLPQPQKSPDR